MVIKQEVLEKIIEIIEGYQLRNFKPSTNVSSTNVILMVISVKSCLKTLIATC